MLSRHDGNWTHGLTLDGVPSAGGGPFETVAARPIDLPKLGANDANQAAVVRPSVENPGSLSVGRMPTQASQSATPTKTQ